MKRAKTKTLVAYDSRPGSTAEVAEFIGRVLSDNGTNVAVRRLEEVDDLTSYDRIVIGSAIRYDRWLPDAVAFVRANRQVLGTKSVAFFFTCLTLAKPTPDAIRTADGYAERLRSIAPDVDPVSVGRFAGVLDLARTPLANALASSAPVALHRSSRRRLSRLGHHPGLGHERPRPGMTRGAPADQTTQ